MSQLSIEIFQNKTNHRKGQLLFILWLSATNSNFAKSPLRLHGFLDVKFLLVIFDLRSVLGLLCLLLPPELK